MGKKPGWDNTINDLKVYKLPPSKLKEKLDSRKPGSAIHSKSSRLFFVQQDEIRDLKKKREYSKNNSRHRNYNLKDNEDEYLSFSESDNDSLSSEDDKFEKLNMKQIKGKVAKRAWDSDNDSSEEEEGDENNENNDYNELFINEFERRKNFIDNSSEDEALNSNNSASKYDITTETSNAYNYPQRIELKSSNTLHWIEKMDAIKNKKSKVSNLENEFNPHNQLENVIKSQVKIKKPKNKVNDLKEAFESVQNEIDEFEKSRNESFNDSKSDQENSTIKEKQRKSIASKALKKWKKYEEHQKKKEKNEDRSNFVSKEKFFNLQSDLSNLVNQFSDFTSKYDELLSVNHRLISEIEILHQKSESSRNEFLEYKKQKESEINLLKENSNHNEILIKDLEVKISELRSKSDNLSQIINNFENNFIIEKDFSTIHQNQIKFEANEENDTQKPKIMKYDIPIKSTYQSNDSLPRKASQKINYDKEHESSSDEDAWNDSNKSSDDSDHFTSNNLLKDRKATLIVQNEYIESNIPIKKPIDPLVSHSRSKQIQKKVEQIQKDSQSQNQNSKIVRSNLPSPTMSFNLIGNQPKSNQDLITNTINNILPETPQPNRSVPYPSNTNIQSQDNDEDLNHKVPMINQKYFESITSPGKQEKVTSKRSLQVNPTLSPRPSINKPTSYTEIQSVQVIGRDRQMLEPIISSQIGKFEIKRFTPNGM